MRRPAPRCPLPATRSPGLGVPPPRRTPSSRSRTAECSLLTVEHCAFSNNEGVNGGGIFIDLSTATGQLTLRESVLTSDNATAHGGGIYANISAGSLLMVGCQVTDNTATSAWSDVMP